MNNEKKPDGIVFYSLTLRNASLLPDAELGQVLKAVWRFCDTGALPEGLDMAQSIVFDMFRQNVVDAVEKYKAVCERNQKNAQNRKNRNHSQPLATNGNDSLQVSQNINTNLIETEFENESERENEQELLFETETKIDREHLLKKEPEWKARQKAWLNHFEGREQQ